MRYSNRAARQWQIALKPERVCLIIDFCI